MNEKVKGNFINETLMSAASKPFQAFSSLSRVEADHFNYQSRYLAFV